MQFTRESVFLLAIETGYLMHKAQLKFNPAFEEAFSKLGFDSEVDQAAKEGVGRLLNSWKKKKKERRIRFLLEGSQKMTREVHEDTCHLV